jgi:PAP2 superfamily protein
MRDLSRPFTVPLLATRNGVRRFVAALDASEASQTTNAIAMRRALGVLFIGYAVLLSVKATLAGTLPSVAHFLLAMFGVALIANLAGRFIRDWTLVLAGVFAYFLAGRYAAALNMPIHYTPQLDADRVLGFGSVPSEWLQQHLYHGRTGPLEVFAVTMYFSHFLAPLLLAFYIWIKSLRMAFKELMFGILAISVLADIVFVLYPTAPPWLAAEHGLVNVHHILKQSLLDLHLGNFASLIGNPEKYNIVAALPSMHAAFPVIALIVAVRYQLPRWIVALQAAQLLGVFFAIVYLGDHYFIDAVAGAAFAFAGATLVRRLLTRPARAKVETLDGEEPLTFPLPEPAPAPAPAMERPSVVLDARS